jgi:cell division protein FtsW (lipid II flippase)
MVENIVRQTTKKTWYKWSLYVNIILFFVVAIMLYFTIMDSYSAGFKDAGGENSEEMFYLMRDISILVIAIALIFFQFFKNLFTIMKRSL